MSDQTPQEYYASQSPITDPAQYTYLYNGLPHDPDGISSVVRDLVLHYMADKWQYNYPPERTCEINTRYVASILERVLELDARPLAEPRTPDTRFIGCCRDFTALSVSMLRHAGVPARSRHGFGAYFDAGYYGDHVVVEFWNGQNWQLSDNQFAPNQFPINLRDVPRDQFVVGGKAWQMCRAGQADPQRFGLGPNGPISGWGFIRSRMMQDLVSLNKTEMLCWEEWKFDGEQEALSESDLVLLDHVAEVTQQGDAGFTEVRRLFTEEERLQLPKVFNNFSPADKQEDLPIAMSLA